jgi:triacylglycerol esterase/lipase EstA (alpha/beta hydrolase family)
MAGRAVRIVGTMLAAATVAAVSLPVSASAELHRRLPVPYGNAALADWIYSELFAPTAVPGANDGCMPSDEHPYPVVLVHGTAENEAADWASLAPLLANHGYCVYALNYGETSISLGDRIDAIGDIPTSASQLSAFIDRVLAETGAKQVDIVGHSQGGMMPNYYIKFLGGAAKVHTLIGLAPSNHGTEGALEQLVTTTPLIDTFVAADAPAIFQQHVGSPFMTKLFADGDTVPGPRYVVIESNQDEIVQPYTDAFLDGPDVTNILLQDQCRADLSEHVGIDGDSPALQDVLNQLRARPDPEFRPRCVDFGASLL